MVILFVAWSCSINLLLVNYAVLYIRLPLFLQLIRAKAKTLVS